MEAADAAGALNRLATLPRLDLLFTDVVLPKGRNGIELAEDVLRLHPHVRVLFASGHTAGALSAHGRWNGEFDLLAKPYRREQLTMHIQAQLERPLETAARAAAAAKIAAEGSPLGARTAPDQLDRLPGRGSSGKAR